MSATRCIIAADAVGWRWFLPALGSFSPCLLSLFYLQILSPAGEYNLRLGIMKELSPDLVFTATHPLEIYEGHPFIVEAAVALGGKAKPGIAVYRYANRIPLLFEGGNDVASVVANTKIKSVEH
jgi:DNA topoisomerase VI subunit B